MPKYVVLQKERGMTPLEAINVWKNEHAGFADMRAAYAGRLDPMAEGKLLVLLGDECKKLKKYTKLDKEYVVEVLLDIGSDTGDVLGLVTNTVPRTQYLDAKLKRALNRELSVHSRRYPVFSSKTVNGKPLFLYALEGTLDQITIPEHIERIYRIQQSGAYTLQSLELAQHIQTILVKVPRSDESSKVLGADFRQDEIRARWQKFFKTNQQSSFTVLKLRVICGSGAYMRTLAQRIGASLGTQALALSINRTKIGHYRSIGTCGVWTTSY